MIFARIRPYFHSAIFRYEYRICEMKMPCTWATLHYVSVVYSTNRRSSKLTFCTNILALLRDTYTINISVFRTTPPTVLYIMSGDANANGLSFHLFEF